MAKSLSFFLHCPCAKHFDRNRSPSADLDSSNICHRFTQATYRLEVAMYQLISLERCSRPATVASEENKRGPYDREGSAGPTSGPLAENRRRITSGAERGNLLGTETGRSASLSVRDVAEISIEDPSSCYSLAEPSLESFN